jgi:kynureninase
MDPLIDLRASFPVLNRTTFMISHSLGAMPESARANLDAYASMWDTRSIRAWEEGWWQMPVAIGDLIGRIIGAGRGEVVMQQNVSISQWIVLSCFDWSERRNKIVSEEFNFPSNLYIYKEAERLGARLVTVPSEDGVTIPLERLLAAIDDETRLVAVSHVLYRSSYIQDLEAIARRAHEVGAMVLADIYQSAGSVPVEVRRWGVDFATGGSVKWLCGGPGAGYLYVRRDLWPSLRPRLTGWNAHRAPFAFEPAPIEYADDIFRFLHGTPNVPAMYAARAGYELVLAAGVNNIRQKSMRQTARLIELGDEVGFPARCPRSAGDRGGTVILDVPHGQDVTRELLRRDVLVDYRPGAGIRIGPHYYNTDEELDVTIREIRAILSTAAIAAG